MLESLSAAIQRSLFESLSGQEGGLAPALSFGEILLRLDSRFGEVACFDDGDLRRVNVPAHRCLYLFWRERVDLAFKLLVPLECAVKKKVVRERARQHVVLRAVDLPRLEIARFAGGDFLRR